MARPSIFSSHSQAGTGTSRVARADHATNSSSLKTLSRESIRSRCSTDAKSVDNDSMTRCVGESGVRSAGHDSSSAASSRILSSYSASDAVGWART